MNHLSLNKNRALALCIGLFVLFTVSSEGAKHTLITEDSSAGLFVGETFRPSHFKKIRRLRKVNLDPIISLRHGLAKDDVLTLNLFDDAIYTTKVDRVFTNINGTVSIRARLDHYSMGYAILSTTNNESTGMICIPEKDLQYCLQKNPATGMHYLFEVSADGIEELQEGSPLIGQSGLDEVKLLEEIAADEPLEPANIDVMIVYTPAAMSWAGGTSGIANVIAQAMEKAQLALDNSHTLLTMTLVYSAPIDYVESGDAYTDLNRLTFKGGYLDPNGYMDEVHDWRYVYQADMVALFANVNDVGGLGWTLSSESGSPDYAFSLSRVQQVGWTYTFIHELGHNLGCDHRKDQVDEPGPGLFSYSAGWRWNGNDSNKYCSIMSYEADGYNRVAYFSNPDILYQGAATGDAVDGDNARTIREIKHVVAAYRSPTGSLQINLSPQDAVIAGAQWRRTGTSVWYNSGSAEQYIPTGNYTVEFSETSGWATPATITVSVSENQLTEAAAVYTEAPEIIIGTGIYEWNYPLATRYEDARTQTIYLAEEIGGPCTLTALGLDIAFPPNQVTDNFTIRLKHTDINVYDSSAGWESLGWTVVYQANEDLTQQTGWVLFHFTAPFVYNGNQNLMVDISYNNSSSSSSGYCMSWSASGVRSLYCRTNSNPDDPMTWIDQSPNPYSNNRVPNLKLVTMSAGCQIGDLDQSCGVDVQDMTIFASTWLQADCGYPDWCAGADFDYNGEVNLADFSVLAMHWLEGYIPYPPYDIVLDGQINADDLLVLIEQWLDSPGIPSADIAPPIPDNFVNFADFAFLAAHWLEGV